MTITLNGTSGIVNDATDLNYTGTLTGGTGVVNIGSGQVYKDASGNVGIGVTSPMQKIQTNGRIRVSSDNTNGGDIAVDGTGLAFSTLGTTQPIIFLRNNYATESARIDSSGNLLVGTTSTSIAGSGSYLSSNGRWTTSTGSGGIFAQFLNGSGTEIGRISNNSNTATTYATSSDYRLKNTIAPMTGALAKVALLKPCTYKWNVDGSDGQGFIAHELDEVVPGCVTGEKDAVETYTDEDGNEATRPVYQGIDTSFLVATLTAALQELKAIVDTQASAITALNERITALEAANV